jgi:protein-S-isoprenylcysteine O-methyltransferase Ste14
MFQAAVFLLASAGILWISWRCLRSPRSHGFYRFFAFEFIAALIVLNAPNWFRDPFSPRQLASWVLLFGSIWPAVVGLRLLTTAGRPTSESSDPAQLGFEKTTALVAVGMYRYIRHPMYASLLGLAWGAALKDLSAPSLVLALAASAAVLATALAEEREDLAHFGPSYAEYMKTTRRFIPFLF